MRRSQQPKPPSPGDNLNSRCTSEYLQGSRKPLEREISDPSQSKVCDF